MPAKSPILVIGATGMLGRPVVRRLVAEGLPVRALVRDPERAAALLPKGIELHRGDLRDEASLRAACHGARAMYLNLAAPMRARPPKWDPERDGTRVAIKAAQAAGVEHVLRISALGVDRAAKRWWAARHKLEADHLVLESGLSATVFRPTWFMESLATMWMGSVIVSPRVKGALRWIAGDDFARMVVAAIREPDRFAPIEIAQGPEAVTMKEAVRRFAAALPRHVRTIPLPRSLIRLNGIVMGKAHYFARLLDMTEREFVEGDREEVESDLPRAAMRIEEYVEFMQETGDRPRK